jgi:hypothetical protein
MDWAGAVADGLSGLSLVAVVVFGTITVRFNKRATAATEGSLLVTQKVGEAQERTTEATEKVALATEQSVAASELAARLAAQDARVRRAEALLDVLLQMRELFNEQMATHESGWMPEHSSPEALAQLALRRKLEARLVPFDAESARLKETNSFALSGNIWTNSILETAIEEAKAVLRQSAGGT